MFSDTLRRHELSHHNSKIDGGRDCTHRITVKTFRACFKCAYARVRCSGGIPCVRCHNRSLECQYPTERRPKSKATKAVSQKISTSKENGLSSRGLAQYSGPSQDEKHMHPEAAGKGPKSLPSHDPTGYSQSGLNGSSGSSDQPGALLDLIFQNMVENGSKYFQEGCHSGSEVLSPTSLSQHPNSQPIHSSSSPISTGDLHFTNPATIFGHGTGNLPLGDGGSALDMGTGDLVNQQLKPPIGPPFFDYPIASTVDWLSSDIPDVMNMQFLPFELPTEIDENVLLENSLIRPTWLPAEGSCTEKNTSLLTLEYVPQAAKEQCNRFVDAVGKEAPHPDLYGAIPGSGNCYSHGDDYEAREYSRNLEPLLTPSAGSVDSQNCLQEYSIQYSFACDAGQVNRLSWAESAIRWSIEESVYEAIFNCFLQLCYSDSSIFPKFECDAFPNAKMLARFIQFYFDRFQPVYPILHYPAFDPNKCHWVVTLAVLAIGSSFANIPGASVQLTAAFHEFLRRAIYIEVC